MPSTGQAVDYGPRSFFAVPVRHDDEGAGLGQGPGRGSADPSAPSRDQRHASVQRFGVHGMRLLMGEGWFRGCAGRPDSTHTRASEELGGPTFVLIL